MFHSSAPLEKCLIYLRVIPSEAGIRIHKTFRIKIYPHLDRKIFRSLIRRGKFIYLFISSFTAGKLKNNGAFQTVSEQAGRTLGEPVAHNRLFTRFFFCS